MVVWSLSRRPSGLQSRPLQAGQLPPCLPVGLDVTLGFRYQLESRELLPTATEKPEMIFGRKKASEVFSPSLILSRQPGRDAEIATHHAQQDTIKVSTPEGRNKPPLVIPGASRRDVLPCARRSTL